MKSGIFTSPDPTRGSCQEVIKDLAGRVGSGQEVFEISWDGTGRVGRFSDLADRDG